jgi:hypothetical protein
MSAAYSAKQLFLTNYDRAKWHRQLVNSTTFQESLTYALAEFTNINPDSQQMFGARKFIDTFKQLSEKLEEPPVSVMPKLVPPENLVPETKIPKRK